MCDIERGTFSDTDPPRTSQASATLRSMREAIRHTARVEAKHDFHSPSRTHVVWCLGVGRGGAKGFGDFADEARRQFETRLEALIERATVGDLERWQARLNQDETTRRREEHVRSLAANQRMGEYSISLDPSQTARFKESSSSKTLNGEIVEALREGLEALRWQAARTTLAGMRQIILDKDAALKAARRAVSAELDVRTLRMDAETHARLHLEAHELGVKLPELCRFAVEAWFLSREAKPEKPVDTLVEGAVQKRSLQTAHTKATIPRSTASRVSEVDFFDDLDTDAFTDIANRVGVNAMFLSRIRDRHIEPDDIPNLWSERVRVALPRHPSPAEWAGYLRGGPQLPTGAMFKSRRKPKALKRMSFEDAVRSSGLTDEQQVALLALVASEI